MNANTQQPSFRTAATPVATPPAPAKPKREKSEMRKITSALDKEVGKVEANKVKIAKLEKAIAEGQTAIKELSAKLARL